MHSAQVSSVDSILFASISDDKSRKTRQDAKLLDEPSRKRRVTARELCSTCSFMDKAIHVAAAGAIGLIVTESGADSEGFVEMIKEDDDRRTAPIPAVFLSGKDG